MFKKIIITTLGIVSLVGINIPVQADDTIYPIDIQNYLMQLAVESDFLQVGDTTKHDHYIIEIPTTTLVEMAYTACDQFNSGNPHVNVKNKIKTDTQAKLPIKTKDKLGVAGVDKFADGVVKSAVNAHCSQHKVKLPKT
ncbi:hypothetical protein [Synechocystis sp. PCC 7509]|uniref:hypothetical protein n=1 Tax=Synechocystis sp. PCC 7509 TaxID=927677 RepID=UPI0002ACCB6E|nr:hypothetical protein [Synechocystis sp. PCC 7509]